MHNVFQRDLSRLHLEVTRAYAKAITTSLTPLTSTPECSLKIAAQVITSSILCDVNSSDVIGITILMM